MTPQDAQKQFGDFAADKLAVIYPIREADAGIGGKPFHGTLWIFHCPGCGFGHWFTQGAGSPWQWNGSTERPTVRPSIKQTIAAADGGKLCHLFIEDGFLRFLADCEHDLAGKLVPMEPWAE